MMRALGLLLVASGDPDNELSGLPDLWAPRLLLPAITEEKPVDQLRVRVHAEKAVDVLDVP